MIQKGDDLINGNNNNSQYLYTVNNSGMSNAVDFQGNNGNLIQGMSFEDYVPLESMLPSVETVLPQYIPTPPPSLPSPSVKISTINTTLPKFQFQLEHQTLAQSMSQLQHNQNINNHQQHHSELQHQQVCFHSSPFQVNHAHNNKNIESTMNLQLFLDHNFNLFKVLL